MITLGQTSNAGFTVVSAMPIGTREEEYIVTAYQNITGKAVTWHYYQEAFFSGHYFDNPLEFTGNANLRNALRDMAERAGIQVVK